MAQIQVRSGVNPDEPEVPVVVVVIDPEGPPAEQVLNNLSSYCYEGDGVLYFAQTDGWAESALAGDRLTVDIVAHPAALKQVDVDPERFPVRSATDPEAVVVLRVETRVDPQVFARAEPGAAVFALGPDETLEDALADEESWPIVVAPPPER
ncbi:hypothetical protein ABZ816_41280 [Actinosynnema sp. NPDC047251]|uniref:Uncharacterized protein n=1 Tax=Saccharothrix espanaensis (strain ATCC 51144 / DSM 44229 / JCM 9112 / NBRC 15066 / NRRL 15764) TaxID=1179773 RepID=K0JXT6_SACES|nr:hypothetical protein [Saccharothrix espanaensis]CCH30112.1 hypothetical protein BN6_28000 [Saccharothrix espanaensis DSM 44229]